MRFTLKPGDRVRVVSSDGKTVRGVFTIQEIGADGVVFMEQLPATIEVGDFLELIETPGGR